MSYLAHFGLTVEPFSNAPMSHFYYDAPLHQQVLARLLYMADSRKGLALVIGDVGTGKTTLARRFLDALPEEEYEAALLVVVHASITANWLLQRIAQQLGVEAPLQEAPLLLLSQLYRQLVRIHEEGRKAILLIDEAQMLETRVLMEEFRELLNFEVAESKLIGFVFFGLPSLEDNLKLDFPLAQRVAFRCQLEPFGSEDTDAYIRHRLRLAGCTSVPLQPEAIAAVHSYSKGIPRVINTICDNALLEAFFVKSPSVSSALIQQTAEKLGMLYTTPSTQ